MKIRNSFSLAGSLLCFLIVNAAECSAQSGAPSAPAPAVMRSQVRVTQLKPDMVNEWLSIQKNEVNPALKKAGISSRAVVENVYGNMFEYLSVTPIENYSVLDGDDPPGGEGLPVADPVDLVEDRDGRVAGAQEVAVQRVDPAFVDRAPGRHERLRGDLAPEDALALLVGLDPAEDVDLDGLEVQEVHQEVQGLAHGAMLAVLRVPRRDRASAGSFGRPVVRYRRRP